MTLGIGSGVTVAKPAQVTGGVNLAGGTEAGGGLTTGPTSSKIVLRILLSMMCWASNACSIESLVCSGDLIFKLCFCRAGGGEDCGNIVTPAGETEKVK